MGPHPIEVEPLAFVPPALVDEALDGYLEYLAHRLSMTTLALHSHIGLRCPGAFGPTRGLDNNQAERLSGATGWSVEQVHAMTLRRYTSSGLMPSKEQRGGGPGPWLRRKGARYCPACLRERGMRWRLSWYLQWTFICTEHRVLLDVACPTCARPPRTRSRGHPLTGAAAAPPGPGTDLRCLCPVPLLADADHHRPPGHAVLDEPVPAAFLRGQQVITERIEARGQVDYLGTRRSTTEWVHDLAALTRLLAVNFPANHIPEPFIDILTTTPSDDTVKDADLIGAIAAAWQPHLGLTPFTAPAARFAQAAASRVSFAVIATVAVRILTVPDAVTAARLLSIALPPASRKESARQSRSRGISWTLARALWLAEHPSKPAQTRALRLGSDRFRHDGAERVPLDRSRVPARPWSTVRHNLEWTAKNPFTGLASTVALLTSATSISLAKACDLLAHEHLSTRVSYETRRLFTDLAEGEGPDIFDDLLRIHDAVTTGAVPIDYERRRRVFRHPVPLSRRTASKVARDLGMRPTPRLARFMSWWIYEQLSGNDVLLQPDLLNLPGAIRLLYLHQRDQWETAPPVGLLRRAEHALLVNSIDEPITWAPIRSADGIWFCGPSTLVRQLDWSGRTPRRSTQPSPTFVQGISIEDVVAVARSRQSIHTDRLAVLLARFHEVAKTGRITDAARSIGISQPTLSVAMRNLEAELATPLLIRSHHAIALTEQGHTLHRILQRRPITHVTAATNPMSAARPLATRTGGQDAS